jgi:hypothetical protein
VRLPPPTTLTMPWGCPQGPSDPCCGPLYPSFSIPTGRLLFLITNHDSVVAVAAAAAAAPLVVVAAALRSRRRRQWLMRFIPRPIPPCARAQDLGRAATPDSGLVGVARQPPSSKAGRRTPATWGRATVTTGIPRRNMAGANTGRRLRQRIRGMTQGRGGGLGGWSPAVGGGSIVVTAELKQPFSSRLARPDPASGRGQLPCIVSVECPRP